MGYKIAIQKMAKSKIWKCGKVRFLLSFKEARKISSAKQGMYEINLQS
jgi:hypothetical protein